MGIKTASRREFIAGTMTSGLIAASASHQALAEEATSFQQASNPAPEANITEERDFDVVVCGAGAAGLNAAVAAAEAGAKVACIEKCHASIAGGSNYGFINAQYLLDAGCDSVDVAERTDQVVKAHMGCGDPLLIHNFVAANGEVGDWMADICDKTGHTFELNLLEGQSMTNYDDAYAMLSEYLESLGGQIFYQMPAVSIDRDEAGQVTGVVAQDLENDTFVRFNAVKGVILATGGIGGNPDMIRRFLPWCDPNGLLDAQPNSAQGGENGDAVTMAEAIGAQINPGLFCEEVHFLSGYWPAQGVLFVDQAGQRIPDNATCCDVNEVRIHVVMGRPGHRGWAITDSKDGWQEISNPMAEINPDYDAVRATSFATLDDVATEFGLDVNGLKSTVKAWNDMVEAGTDDLYGTDLTNAMALDTPPFHAVEAKGATMAFMGGPVVNANLEVVDDKFLPIPGLYAVGNACSGFWGVDYIMTLWAGMNKSWAAVSGYLAGKAAMK